MFRINERKELKMTNIDFRTIRIPKVKLLILVLVIMIMSAIGVNADNKGLKHNAADEESGQQILPMASNVSIEKKTLEAVITNIGDRYALFKGTIITDMNGQQMSIREMLVPCEADVTFEIRKGRRIAHRIKIIRTHSNASWHWVSDGGE